MKCRSVPSKIPKADLPFLRSLVPELSSSMRGLLRGFVVVVVGLSGTTMSEGSGMSGEGARSWASISADGLERGVSIWTRRRETRIYSSVDMAGKG